MHVYVHPRNSNVSIKAVFQVCLPGRGTAWAMPASGRKIVKYILLIYQDENTRSASAREACKSEAQSLIADLTAKGQYLGAAPLHPTATAVSVRTRDGKRMVTDGPFAETHEQLGGFYLVDTPNVDEAIEIAGRISGVHTGTIEIRPVMDLPDLAAE